MQAMARRAPTADVCRACHIGPGPCPGPGCPLGRCPALDLAYGAQWLRSPACLRPRAGRNFAATPFSCGSLSHAPGCVAKGCRLGGTGTLITRRFLVTPALARLVGY